MIPKLTNGFGLTIDLEAYDIEYHKEESRGMWFEEFTYATSRN
jgi:hypothetical protein